MRPDPGHDVSELYRFGNVEPEHEHERGLFVPQRRRAVSASEKRGRHGE